MNKVNGKFLSKKTLKIKFNKKTYKVKIMEFIQIDKIPIPFFSKETNEEKLMDFTLNLPEKIYNENQDKIKGVLIFIDEFQIIKELNNYKESFLWKIRSYIQNQRNIAYIFSGSMSLQDKLISEIASQNGAFGGRMISININPFEKKRSEIIYPKKHLIFYLQMMALTDFTDVPQEFRHMSIYLHHCCQ